MCNSPLVCIYLSVGLHRFQVKNWDGDWLSSTKFLLIIMFLCSLWSSLLLHSSEYFVYFSECLCVFPPVLFHVHVCLPPSPQQPGLQPAETAASASVEGHSTRPFFENPVNSSFFWKPIQLVIFLKTHSTCPFLRTHPTCPFLKTYSTCPFFENPFNSSFLW